ncbi:MAG: 50S ribosomal protein L2 [Candidatus Thermoplasmatota archaeon]|nr:50S ribosomal protein L2 [Candidatus Thermoplasmatota archaeon]
MGKKLIQQRRGRTKGRYSAPTHRFRGKIKYPPGEIKGTGIVEDIIHDPGHTAPLASVRLENNKKVLTLAPEGIKVGDEIKYSDKKGKIKSGNVLPVGKIDEGFPIHNIEVSPGDGGKLVRAGGNNATVVSHNSGKTVIRLPSGKFKTIQSSCRATMGVLAGGGRKDKPFLKAGKKYHAFRTRGKQYPVVRGVAMNSVAHPHGGGGHQHVGKSYTVKRGASPGRKVGSVAARRTGRK